MQQEVPIISMNLLGDEPLASEELHTVLFGTRRLKITIKRYTACCVCQDYASNVCQDKQNFRSRAGDSVHLALERELYEQFFLEKNFYSGI